jgi:hypothetical protein
MTHQMDAHLIEIKLKGKLTFGKTMSGRHELSWVNAA